MQSHSFYSSSQGRRRMTIFARPFCSILTIDTAAVECNIAKTRRMAARDPNTTNYQIIDLNLCRRKSYMIRSAKY